MGFFSPPPPPPPPEAEPLVDPIILGTVCAGALVAAGIAFGLRLTAPRQPRNNAELEAELRAAEAKVKALRQQLNPGVPPSPSASRRGTPGEKPLRIWMDGAFDMMHYGHVNAFRQGRAVGTHLVVGVNDDLSITAAKGAAPVMNDAERLAMVQACKFVDEVVPNVPYVMSDEYVRWMMKTYNIDYVVHGDDPCIVDGRDVYESAQALGKYKTIPRTEGVSTTEIVGRMLLLTNDHHAQPQKSDAGDSPHASPLLTSNVQGQKLSEAIPFMPLDGGAPSSTPPPPSAAAGNGNGAAAAATVIKVSVPKPTPSPPPAPLDTSFVRESKFLTTSRMLRLFAAGCTAPPPGAKVVYVDGGWDMFHGGHADFLKQAAALGDFLLVGVHNDVQVNRHRGRNFPIMNLNERTLSVLACRHVGDVVIDPPWHMTREMIAALGITVVAHGEVNDPNDDDGMDPYKVPKELGIFREVKSSMTLTVDSILQRLHANREKLAKKVEKKMAAEREYYDNRYGFEGAAAAKAAS